MRRNAVATSSRPVLRTLQQVRVGRATKLPALADQTGINKGSLSQIERGLRVATDAELLRLTAVLGVRFENRLLPVTSEADA